MLGLLDQFEPPYEDWQTRRPSNEEIIANGSMAPIKIQLLETIEGAVSAANYTAMRDGGSNQLSGHIDSNLNKNEVYKSWQRSMPPRTPRAIAQYQKNYKDANLVDVSNEIVEFGSLISSGQCLFHGGLWRGGSVTVTERPLSTSLCPQVALKNAEYKSKAYDSGRLDLIVFRITNPDTKVFVFKRNGTGLGHEKEVLIASGVKLVLISDDIIRSDYPVSKVDQPNKTVPIHVLQVDVC